jgi:peptidoglycan/LPS O-acetylase OafA/YrhL
VVICAAAWMSWKLYEKPMIRLGRRIADRRQRAADDGRTPLQKAMTPRQP